MQNAKDTFYLTLQGRLAALNPARTIVLRGIVRPATLVDENEVPTAAPPTDAFRLQWTKLLVTSASPLPWIALECTIHYATDGTARTAAWTAAARSLPWTRNSLQQWPSTRTPSPR